MVPLTTARLRLRAWTEDDADFVYDVGTRWEVQRWIGAEPKLLRDREEALARIGRWREHDDGIRGVWAVRHADDDRLLGCALLVHLRATGGGPCDETEIGWNFHPDAWGHGYATEAAAALLRHASAAGVGTVLAVTHPENIRSQAVCRRLGMTHAGQTGRFYDMTCELFTTDPPAAQQP